MQNEIMPENSSLWAFPTEQTFNPAGLSGETRQLMAEYDSLEPLRRTIVDLCACSFSQLRQSDLTEMLTPPGGAAFRQFGVSLPPGTKIFRVLKLLKEKNFLESLTASVWSLVSLNQEFNAALLFRKFRAGTYFQQTDFFKIASQRRLAPREFLKQCRDQPELLPLFALDAAFWNDAESFQQIWKSFQKEMKFSWKNECSHPELCRKIVRPIFESPFDPTFFNQLRPAIRETYVSMKLDLGVGDLEVLPAWLEEVMERQLVSAAGSRTRTSDPLVLRYLQYLILTGRGERVRSVLSDPKFNECLKFQFEAVLHFFDGDVSKAVASFKSAEALECGSVRKKHEFETFFEFFHILCAFHGGDVNWNWIRTILAQNRFVGTGWELLARLEEAARSETHEATCQLRDHPEVLPGVIVPFVRLLVAVQPVWFRKANRETPGNALELAEQIRAQTPPEFEWFRRQAECVLQNLQRLEVSPEGFLPTLVKFQDRWELVRQAFANLKKPVEEDFEEPSSAKTRMTWRFFKDDDSFCLEPYEQTRKLNGEWTAGKKVALSRLFAQEGELNFLTPQDQKIVQHLKAHRSFNSQAYRNVEEFQFSEDVVLGLVGHPLVFDRSNPERRLTIKASDPILEVIDEKGKSLIRLTPFPLVSDRRVKSYCVICRTAPDTYEVYSFGPIHLEVAQLLQWEGLEIPKEREKEVGELLAPIMSHFRVNAKSKAASSLASAETVESVKPDSRIHLFLEPESELMSILVRVFPLGLELGGTRPAAGNETFFSQRDGKTFCACREFAAEKKNWDQLVKACPMLEEAQHEKAKERFTLQSTEDVLEFLAELEEFVAPYRISAADETSHKKKRSSRKKAVQEFAGEAESAFEPQAAENVPITENLSGDAPVAIHWPRGQKMRVSSAVSFKNLRLSMVLGRGWFEADGSVQVDQEEMDLVKLLLAMEESQSRFVEIRPNEFVTLSARFRQKLEEFQTFSRIQGTHIRIHPLAVPAAENVLEPVNSQFGQFAVPDAWKETLERFRNADAQAVHLPQTFRGTLRDYQLDGFQWLSQLAAWGAGGCLADDMGLGKTVQAIAILLLRANSGPALVVAPTSVCANWERELERFAPSLTVKRIAACSEISGRTDRASRIRIAGAREVLVTNYAILQREAEAFAKKHFATIVLDEAQAIKNHQTERTQAVLQLQGDFRFVTTGTPIENNLSELWSLFEFINPGFLGTKREFDKKFANPIQQAQSPAARNRLKRMVRPFILRRTKGDVLPELPPKTEIQLDVELSGPERALYEATRSSAVEQLQNAAKGKSNVARIQILAELMKLRRACCHPRLVLPESDAPCSKLEALTSVTQEVLANRHKILIFSQFTDYLKLTAEHFESEKISYQYLDGSMTQKKRQEAIDAFQTGNDGVFLISLKAGGMGLNLTAADYVIHADPWWNPAVESQASDRVHRIGQTRPVTIYRMIAKNTIEEKILELHQRKTQLAQELLSGAETPATVSLEELLSLLEF